VGCDLLLLLLLPLVARTINPTCGKEEEEEEETATKAVAVVVVVEVEVGTIASPRM
jgi:hypothetical protein